MRAFVKHSCSLNEYKLVVVAYYDCTATRSNIACGGPQSETNESNPRNLQKRERCEYPRVNDSNAAEALNAPEGFNSFYERKPAIAGFLFCVKEEASSSRASVMVG